MSRVIVERFENGGERIVVGYDRPLATFFAHEYDAEGDALRAVIGIPPINTVADLRAQMEKEGIPTGCFERHADLAATLTGHTELEYPWSNAVYDLTAA